MTMKLNAPLDLNRNQLLNAVIQTLVSAPIAPVEGMFYYSSVLKTELVFNGTTWIPTDASKMANGSIPIATLSVDPLARANHTGTQLSSTISNFVPTAKAITLDAFAAPIANIPMAGFTLTGLNTTPVAGQAAEVSWVLSQVQAAAAGIDNKPSARLVSIVNIPTPTGLLLVDGFTTVAGDRVLLVGQTNPVNNGIYVAGVGAWSRATDVITSQAFWLVEEGITGNGNQWKVSTTGAITVGVTALAINLFNVTTAYNAGSGLTLTGSLFAVDATVVAKKFSTTIGDGVTTTFVITHNLNTLDVSPTLRHIPTGSIEQTDIISSTVNSVTVSFSVAPAVGAYRVTVIG